MKTHLTARSRWALLLGALTLMMSVAPQTASAKKHRLARALQSKIASQYGLFGIKINTSFASIEPERTGANDKFINNPESLATLGFGLTVDKGINRYVSVRAEALYQNKSFGHSAPEDYNLSANPSKVESETYLDYIEIPVGLVAGFQPGHLIQPYVSGGFYGALLLTADGRHTGLGTNDEARLPFRTFDYGWYLGAGSFFVLAEGAGFLGAELKYSQGMTNIADNEVEVKSSTGDQIKPLEKQTYVMSNFSLAVSYYF